MALLDLSLVTKTLVSVITEAINISPVKPPQLVTVTSLPPDRLAGDNTVGMYMYHVVEEAALKNQPWRGRPDQPIKFSPLGLNLHYVLGTKSELAEELGPYREQLLMSIAVKALHDYPIIDDATQVGGVFVMQAPGDENKLRIALRHVPAAEAIAYWTAGSHPLRLSAYYEVSVVLLEPEEPDRASGRVLTYGIDTFIGGLPRLSTSRSIVTFTIPGEATARDIEVQPAQAAIGDELTLIGSGLGGGTLALFVRGPGWPRPVEVGAGWGTSGSGDRVFATVQDHADAELVFPGTYVAHVVVTRTTTLSDGTQHIAQVPSTEAPFQVVPQIAAVGAPSPQGVFVVTGALFAHPTIPALSPQVRTSIASAQLVPGTAGALNPGEFAVLSPAQIEMRIPAGAVPGQFLPFRVVINGCESHPSWVQVP